MQLSFFIPHLVILNAIPAISAIKAIPAISAILPSFLSIIFSQFGKMM